MIADAFAERIVKLSALPNWRLRGTSEDERDEFRQTAVVLALERRAKSTPGDSLEFFFGRCLPDAMQAVGDQQSRAKGRRSRRERAEARAERTGWAAEDRLAAKFIDDEAASLRKALADEDPAMAVEVEQGCGNLKRALKLPPPPAATPPGATM